MTGDLGSIPILIPIVLIISIIKFILFNLKRPDGKREEKYSFIDNKR